jgi:AraC-like DNA-binding protein
MNKVDFTIRKDLEPYINCIMVQKSADPLAHTNIPLYADGYPGIMFQQAENGFYLLPRKKKLSELFLYGQTLQPVSLDVTGPFKFVVLQLYPFASKYLLGIDPKELNDDCFDLLQLDYVDVESFHRKLIAANDLQEQVNIISDLMLELIKAHQSSPNDKIQQAIELILRQHGQVTIKNLLDELFITERTFERNFMAQVGLSPKQFAKIVQFQCSLQRLNKTRFDKLIEISHDSGFADQSHFIRAFKKYTGQTPSFYLKQSSSV